MIFDGRSLADISIDDIYGLIENQVCENGHLEYKEEAYSGRQQDKREMLRDITSLANSEGGYLILGVRENGIGCAESLEPIDDVSTKVQAIRLTCLDGIRERITGLEIQAYETQFNQGVILVRVPPSNQQPHMITLDGRTDFIRRYETDKRPMTIAEIKGAVISCPPYDGLVPQPQETTGQEGQLNEQSSHRYIKIIEKNPVESFHKQYIFGDVGFHNLVIVSPYITSLGHSLIKLEDMIDKITREKVRTYVITREPKQEHQKRGMDILKSCPYCEIRYNQDIHAKLYLCWCKEEKNTFALFSSGNLTEKGVLHNLEIGMMIFSQGYGSTLLRQLYHWSSFSIRSMSKKYKSITA